ncbi:MAG: enoyl-CoA hydratase [Pseudomonadota bacterium]
MTDILLRDDAEKVATLTLNRPEALNALSEEMMTAVQDELERIAVDSSVKAVVLKGAGRAFCAGHDIKQMQGKRQAPDGGKAYYSALLAQCTRLMTTIPHLPQPVIAQVHGIATAAGCQLVATCDMAVCTETTRFGVNGVNIGLFCSTPMVALSRNIPRKHAFEMLTTGEFLTPDRARDLGLVNRVVAEDDLESETRALAETVASKLGSAVKVGKRAYYEQLEMPLDAAYLHTSRVIVDNLLHPDTVEGMQAFLDKRPPDWPD